MTDWMLRGGEVIDGSGRKRRRADVAIAGDRIAAVGTIDRVAGAREVDVTGKIVAPGFIDVHTHDDRALFATPDMAAKVVERIQAAWPTVPALTPIRPARSRLSTTARVAVPKRVRRSTSDRATARITVMTSIPSWFQVM